MHNTVEKFTMVPGRDHLLTDLVAVRLTPSDLERYYQIMKARAEQCVVYEHQKDLHRIVDHLAGYLDEYKAARKQFEKFEKLEKFEAEQGTTSLICDPEVQP